MVNGPGSVTLSRRVVWARMYAASAAWMALGLARGPVTVGTSAS